MNWGELTMLLSIMAGGLGLVACAVALVVMSSFASRQQAK
jgi:hypothetical protein